MWIRMFIHKFELFLEYRLKGQFALLPKVLFKRIWVAFTDIIDTQIYMVAYIYNLNLLDFRPF